MANEAHLAILMKGVRAWNAWREAHPEIAPHLSDTNMSEANLSEANLTNTNLIFADLIFADLRYTTLRAANL